MDNPAQLPPLVLAYVGDAVYELWVREKLVQQGAALRPGDLHRAALGWVRAEAQAAALQAIESELAEDEQDVVRRARNQRPSHPTAATQTAYRLSTGLEALCGYLYLGGKQDRLESLLDQVSAVLPWSEQNEVQT